jgi:hypothetical protein
MPVVLTVFITANFLGICWQDFKSRQIYLANYLVLYLLYLVSVIFGIFTVKPDNIILNMHLSLIILSMLFMYYLIRYKTEAFRRIKSSIGVGDVMMLPVFMISFSVFNFVAVYMISLIISLVYSLGTVSFKRNSTVPFAGIQAIILTVCYILHVTGITDMQNDIFQF